MKWIISKIVTIAILFFATTQAYAQVDTLNNGPEPIGGIDKLALAYYKIDFTKAQRETLQELEVELIYTIDKNGIATLEEINGVNDSAIKDSLQQITNKLPKIYPRNINGVTQSSLYFLKLQFPTYKALGRPAIQQTITFQETLTYKEHKYEDFEYIHKSGERLDIVFGGVMNTFLGSPNKYLSTGGGMKLDLMFIGKGKIGGGMVMGFYGNRLKQNYPISSGREQNSAPPTLLLGLGLNKILAQQERRELNVQLELAYAIQNITPKLDANDNNWTQLQGFSPGVVANYLVQIGKNKAFYYYGRPSIYSHYINVHGAVRPVLFNLKEASGVMLEAGIAYRLGCHFVDDYRLKPSY